MCYIRLSRFCLFLLYFFLNFFRYARRCDRVYLSYHILDVLLFFFSLSVAFVEMCKFIYLHVVIFAYGYSLAFSVFSPFFFLSPSTLNSQSKFFSPLNIDQGSFPAMAAMDLTNGTTWEKDYTKNDTINQSNERARVKRTFVEIVVGQCVRYWRRFSARWNQFISDGHWIKVRKHTRSDLQLPLPGWFLCFFFCLFCSSNFHSTKFICLSFIRYGKRVSMDDAVMHAVAIN